MKPIIRYLAFVSLAAVAYPALTCDSTDPSYTDQLSVNSNAFHDALAIAQVKAGRACIPYEAMRQNGVARDSNPHSIDCYEARLIHFKLQARKDEHRYQYEQRVNRNH